MTRDEFQQLISRKLVFLDGAMGTEFSQRGMPNGVCPEQWVLEHPEALIEVQRAYRQAGSDIVYTCTFGGNRAKLGEFDLADRVVEMNCALAQLSREAVDDGLVFGNLAPSGRFVEPFGDLAFEESVEIYKEQVQGLLKGGVDGFAIETMMDIQEARAALLAVKESCDLPVIVSMTFGEDGSTLTGTDPVSALVTLQSLGADAVGSNCSTGPERMLDCLKAMIPYARIPIFAKPNAGMPRLVDGKTQFDMSPDDFGTYVDRFVEAGIRIIGGCCGTTPAHIASLSSHAEGCELKPLTVSKLSAVSSSRKTVCIGNGNPLRVIGERINPTGKKKLQAELREGKFGLVRQYALEQTKAGADLLDVNMGLSGIDEAAMMRESISLLSRSVEAPLCIDTTKPEVMEEALRLYPGRALLNSISLEKERIEKALPIAAKYGAMIILLPLSDNDVPETCEGRIAATEAVFLHAEQLGLKKQDIVIDGLVMTVSANADAAKETLDFIDWSSNTFGANTVVGLSNVSFGLPQRQWINSAFLAMNMARGLTMAIANPANDLLMATRYSADALIGRDPKCISYTRHFTDAAPLQAATTQSLPPEQAAFAAIVEGNEETILTHVQGALDKEIKAQTLVHEHLIPAIQEVGNRFDRKEYFLPQLMMSADTMKKACDFLAPLLAESGDESGPAPIVLLATVEGDIHDIGKNLVSLMLTNHGFQVVDLGKDVSAEEIVDVAAQKNASVIGLSALMTTTMTEMQEVVDLAKTRGINLRIMIGGAVVDESYAKEIGADGYAADAVGAVKLAGKLSEDGQ